MPPLRETWIHPAENGGRQGTYFAVWAPNAAEASVIGAFNDWDRQQNYLSPRKDKLSGVWEGFGLRCRQWRTVQVLPENGGWTSEKRRSVRLFQSSRTASIVWDHEYTWNDTEWMANRKEKRFRRADVCVRGPYRVMEEKSGGGIPVAYLQGVGPRVSGETMLSPWGSLTWEPASRHGASLLWFLGIPDPWGTSLPRAATGLEDFMYMVDVLHQKGIGVILDWVPSHFPTDAYGLARFDGTCLYEHEDPRKGYHPDWGRRIFNYGRNEVRGFLLSAGRFSARSLPCRRAEGGCGGVHALPRLLLKAGEWIPNTYGGRENLRPLSSLKN